MKPANPSPSSPSLPVLPLLGSPKKRRTQRQQKIGRVFTFCFSFFITLLVVRAISGSIMPSVVIPPIQVPNPNAFVEAGKLTDKDKDAIGYAVVPKPGKEWSHAEKQALLIRYAPALVLARRGLTLPYRDASGPRSFRTEFPQYAEFRSITRLMILEGDVKRENGDPSGAVQSYTDAFVFGHTRLQGAPILGHMVGRASEAGGRKSLWKTLGTMDAQTAKHAARRLQAVCDANPGSFADALVEEKYWGQSGIMEFFKGRDIPRFSLAFAVMNKREIMNNYTAYMDAMAANARQPYQVHPKLPSEPTDILNQILLPVGLYDQYKVESYNTQNNLLITSLALQAYRADHKGLCPEKLSALVPTYLSHVPNDPLSYPIAPICYKRTNGAASYVLYSVGPDGKDDNGTPITDYKPTIGKNTKTSRYFTTAASKGDIVAGLNIQ